ncbi:MAG: YihY/virulence factor BrkB family protein, partial [Clostridiales bacterium]|nr:YihY/virulence factor BrkB family protein [Clostridiales bacterium]
GAIFAALGWVLFSYFYSLYIQYFPSASYLYGSLAAIVFLMLWLYICMMILIYGAEINKYIFRKWSARKQRAVPAVSAEKTVSQKRIVSGRKKK